MLSTDKKNLSTMNYEIDIGYHNEHTKLDAKGK
jgi:hypothetical protein